MKHIILLTLTVLFTANMAFAQNDKILGIWWNQEKDAKIKVYKKGDKYFGEIIWLKKDKNDDGTSPKRDKNNPNAKLKKRTIVGTNILLDLKWDASAKEWNGGEIYDPRGGSTYSLFAVLRKDGSLFIKGYMGFSLFGKSTIWTRVK